MSRESVWEESGKTGGLGFYVRSKDGKWVYQSWTKIHVHLPPTRDGKIALLKHWEKEIGSDYAMSQCSGCHYFHNGQAEWTGDKCDDCGGTMTKATKKPIQLVKPTQLVKPQSGFFTGEVRKLPAVNSPIWTTQWSVAGSAKDPYIVSRKKAWSLIGGNVTSEGFACSCMAFTRNTPREDCKHILKVKLFEGVSTAAKVTPVADKEYAEFLKLKAAKARAKTVDGEVVMVGDKTGRRFR